MRCISSTASTAYSLPNSIEANFLEPRNSTTNFDLSNVTAINNREFFASGPNQQCIETVQRADPYQSFELVSTAPVAASMDSRLHGDTHDRNIKHTFRQRRSMAAASPQAPYAYVHATQIILRKSQVYETVPQDHGCTFTDTGACAD